MMKYLARLSTLLFGVVLGALAVSSGDQHLRAREGASQVHDSATHQVSQAAAIPVTEITLERATGLPFHIAKYKVTLQNSGMALYVGDGEAERKGKYKGYVSRSDFNGLIELIEQQNFFAFQKSYGNYCNDGAWAITSAVLNGKRKAVYTSGCYTNSDERFRFIPPQLYELEKEIDTLAARIDWRPDR